MPYRKETYTYDPEGNRHTQYRLLLPVITSRAREAPANSAAADTPQQGNTVASVSSFKYDEAGNRVEELQYDGATPSEESFEQQLLYRYDTDAKLIERVQRDEPDEPGQKTAFTYNAQGDLLESRLENPALGFTVRYFYANYERDAHGNWTKRMETVSYEARGTGTREPSAMMYRTITYENTAPASATGSRTKQSAPQRKATATRTGTPSRPDVRVPNTGGHLVGTLTDRGGKIIADAGVLVVERTTGQHFEERSSEAGKFEFANLPAGTYVVRVGRSGFTLWEKADVHVSASRAAVLEITLEEITAQEPSSSPIPFDPLAWQDRRKASSREAVRIRMVNNLLSRYELKGLSREEVVRLLGEPDDTASFREWDMVYWLGPERGFISIDSEWLVLRLDEQGRVTECRIVSD
jgi:YD repeat-containing protein